MYILGNFPPNTSPSATFIPNHFPLLATFVHSHLDNFADILSEFVYGILTNYSLMDSYSTGM